MIFNYRLNGLDCANCAAKIERNISKIKGVSDVNVTFMTQKLTFASDREPADELDQAVRRVDKKITISREDA